MNSPRPTMSAAKTWVMLVVAGIIALVYYAADISTWIISRSAPAYTLPAIKLMQEYEQNEIKADLTYKGKIVQVSGGVRNTGKDIAGKIYVAFNVGNVITCVQCYFTSDMARMIAEIRPGQQATIKGHVDGKMGNVFLRNCTLVR